MAAACLRMASAPQAKVLAFTAEHGECADMARNAAEEGAPGGTGLFAGNMTAPGVVMLPAALGPVDGAGGPPLQ